MIEIRQVRDVDYDDLSALLNANFPHDLYTADELRYMDAQHSPPYLFKRLVAVANDTVVGSGSFVQHAGMYHPQKFYILVVVDQNHRWQGIGRRLYEQLLQALEPHKPISLRAQIQEQHRGMIRKLKAMGFVETNRDWESTLRLNSFDTRLLSGLNQASQRIQFTTMAELGDDEDHRRRYFDFYNEVRRDVPRAEPATDLDYDFFQKHVFNAPDYIPEGLFLALDEGKFVAMSQVFKGASSLDLYTGLTAVHRDYRGQKIAQALKLRVIAYALEIGSPAIHTDNASTNVEMLVINDKLGFKRHPAWLSLLKTFEVLQV